MRTVAISSLFLLYRAENKRISTIKRTKNRRHPTEVECRLFCPILSRSCRFRNFLKLLSYRHTPNVPRLFCKKNGFKNHLRYASIRRIASHSAGKSEISISESCSCARPSANVINSDCFIPVNFKIFRLSITRLNIRSNRS